MQTLAPIALFVYNRVDHLDKTVQSLKNNVLADQSDLIIFSDGYKKSENNQAVNSVRAYLKNISGFKSLTIIEREKNYGLANSIIDGVTKVTNQYGKVIVIEDDLVTSRYFLQFMNDALNLYEQEPDVISVHGYQYPVNQKLPQTFFLYGADCWGWATWKRGWDIFEHDAEKLLLEIKKNNKSFRFDWNGSYPNTKMLKQQISGKVNSWAIRWHASALLKNKLTLYPGISLVNNIGGDSFATHTKSLDKFQAVLTETPIQIKKIPVTENEQAYLLLVGFFQSIKRSFFQKIKEKLLLL